MSCDPGDDKTIVVIVNDECAQTQSVQPEREIDAPETLETAAAAETCKEDSGCAEENPAPVETESDQETENEDNNAEQTEEKQGDFVKPSALVQQDNLEHTAAEAQENAAVPVSEQDIKEEHNIEDHAESRLEIDNQAVVPEENAHKNGEENTGPYTVEVQRYANTIVRFLRTRGADRGFSSDWEAERDRSGARHCGHSRSYGKHGGYCGSPQRNAAGCKSSAASSAVRNRGHSG